MSIDLSSLLIGFAIGWIMAIIAMLIDFKNKWGIFKAHDSQNKAIIGK